MNSYIDKDLIILDIIYINFFLVQNLDISVKTVRQKFVNFV